MFKFYGNQVISSATLFILNEIQPKGWIQRGKKVAKLF